MCDNKILFRLAVYMYRYSKRVECFFSRHTTISHSHVQNRTCVPKYAYSQIYTHTAPAATRLEKRRSTNPSEVDIRYIMFYVCLKCMQLKGLPTRHRTRTKKYSRIYITIWRRGIYLYRYTCVRIEFYCVQVL